MEDDWDLQAVVRGCSTATTTTTTTNNNTTNNSSNAYLNFSEFQQKQQQQAAQVLFSLPPDPIKPRHALEELHDLYKPFFPKPQPPPPIITPTNLSPLTSLSSLTSFSPLTTPPPKDYQTLPIQPHQHLHNHHPKPSSSSHSAPAATTTTPRSKKRKNQLKKVCQVPAEGLSSDTWAWRKYGQKPIKGSSYPRGYYRCSSSKGCMARKQVERNRSDPNMFIVTYTAEHNHPAPTHRNSLAGSTRQKPFSPQTVTAGGGDSTKPTSPETSASVDEEPVVPQSTTTVMEVCKEEKSCSPLGDDEEDELFGMCDSAVSDDFFVGLEGLAGDYFSGQSPASFGLPWISSNAATAAGSI